MRGNSLFKLIDRLVGVPKLWFLGLFKARHPELLPLRQGSTLLVVKLSAMGDCLLLLPILKAVREQIGAGGRIEVVVTPVTAMVVQGLDWIDAVHVLRPGEFLTRPWRFLKLLLRLRRERFDWALDFDQWLRISALIAVNSRPAAGAGFKTRGQSKHLAFDATAPNNSAKHEFEQFCDVAALAGIPRSAVPDYAGFLSKIGWKGASRSAVGATSMSPALRPNAPIAVLHIGCGRHGWQREWPVERYAELVPQLRSQGFAIALSGSGAYEAGLIDELQKLAGPADEVLLNGSIESLVALLGRASLLISGNTGVMHLGAGVGTPLIALHGPTNAAKWGPLATKSVVLKATVPCSPCLSLGFEYGCPERPCMESIPVAAVKDAAAQLKAPT